ncbi:MAG: flagellar basal body-associated FliL family protein [Gammaproteobacteria bacterium]
MAEAKEGKAKPGKGSGTKKIMMLAVIGIVLIGGSVGGTLVLSGALGKTKHAEENATPAEEHGAESSGASGKHGHGPAQYLAMDPPLVVNFEDEGTLRYVQIGIAVMARDKDAIDAVTLNTPRIRNDLIMLFGGQKFADLSAPEGKEKLRGDSLAAIQGILKEETGKPGIEAVYFTNFVMQ